MAFDPITQKALKGPFNRDSLRLWATDLEQTPGNTTQVILAGDLFDQLLFSSQEPFTPLVGVILDAEKQYRFKADLKTDLSISVINLPNGEMVMGILNPIKKDAKFLINGKRVPLFDDKPTMVIAIQTADDLDDTGNSLFIISEANNTIEPPSILFEPIGGTYIEGDTADLLAQAAGYKDVIVVKNGEVQEGLTAAALSFPVTPGQDGTVGAYIFGFVSPFDDKLISWTKPVVIKIGEATPAKITSQSQSQRADAGTDVILDMEAIGTPPPAFSYIEQIDGQDGPIYSGKQLKVTVLKTRTFIPVVENSYKVKDGTDNEFDPDGKLKSFSDRGTPITITKVGLPQAAPTNPVVNNSAKTFNWTDQPDVDSSVPRLQTFDGGVTSSPINGKPITGVPDMDIPAGKVGVKYGETDTHNASDWLFNQDQYTGSIQPFTDWAFPDYGADPPSFSLTNTNRLNVLRGTSNGGRLDLPSNVKLTKNAGNYVEADMFFDSSNANTPYLVLNSSTGELAALSQQGNGVYAFSGNTQTFYGGNSQPSGVKPISNGDTVRFEITSSLKVEFKVLHNGVWTSLGVFDYPTELYIRAFGIVAGSYMIVRTKGV